MDIDKNIVLMYGCPVTDWKPIEEIEPWKPIEIKPIEVPKKDMNYFRKKFVELFEELESIMGECKSVIMKRDGDFIETDIKF